MTMGYQLTSASYLQFLPFLFTWVLVVLLWKKRNVEGVLYLIFFELATAIWVLADILEHAAVLLETKIFWSQFALIGASTIPPTFLLFTLAYYRSEKLPSRKISWALFIIPIINLSLSLTNQYHHLVWEKVELIHDNGSIYYYGPWFWIYVTYELGISILAVILLLSNTIRFYKIYKQQILYLVLATIAPFVACILYIFKLTPLNFDLTPISMVLIGIFVALAIFRQGMLEILPVAREQIVENLSDGILVIDMGGRIVDANEVMSFITQLKHEELIGKSFQRISDYVIPSSLISSAGYAMSEKIISTSEGNHYYEIIFKPITLQNQTLIGKVFIFHDITKRKKALDAALESNNLLKKEIKEKEELIKDLDAYARSVAHDLKNPIFGLLGISDLVKDFIQNQKKEEAVEILELAHEQSLKMYKIVDELLLLSRIRKEDVQPVPLNIPDLIREAVKRLKGHAQPIDIVFPETWPEVYGHPQWIEEVWFNLISNALKYGGNPPKIHTGYNLIDGSVYRFWIQDNGNGLSQESLNKLFQDFERLGHKNKEGHGLGLSIIKRIIEKLGGEVQVTSENMPGKGCIFSFTLRAVEKIGTC